eukprot:6211947-Pleurochrysis_carterae.AAC.4
MRIAEQRGMQVPARSDLGKACPLARRKQPTQHSSLPGRSETRYFAPVCKDRGADRERQMLSQDSRKLSCIGAMNTIFHLKQHSKTTTNALLAAELPVKIRPRGHVRRTWTFPVTGRDMYRFSTSDESTTLSAINGAALAVRVAVRAVAAVGRAGASVSAAVDTSIAGSMSTDVAAGAMAHSQLGTNLESGALRTVHPLQHKHQERSSK